ncbi:hypothetical protein [Hoylesella enoeca]|uniref:hypothetical protein n=1 Tax=Hoylesella enoeca TaxID=76123 RepID=UPI000ACF97A3|nr:hypothetical protein [Hoylesella enoeca]
MRKKVSRVPRSSNFSSNFTLERHALLTFYAKTTQRVTLRQLFEQFHARAPRSAHFLRKYSAERHAPATFCPLTKRSATK